VDVIEKELEASHPTDSKTIGQSMYPLIVGAEKENNFGLAANCLSKLSINATTSLTFVFTATLFFGSFVVN
jgi:hypothetical protein